MSFYDWLQSFLPNILVDGFLVIGLLAASFTAFVGVLYLIASVIGPENSQRLAGTPLRLVEGDEPPTLSPSTLLFDQDEVVHPSLGNVR